MTQIGCGSARWYQLPPDERIALGIHGQRVTVAVVVHPDYLVASAVQQVLGAAPLKKVQAPPNGGRVHLLILGRKRQHLVRVANGHRHYLLDHVDRMPRESAPEATKAGW